MSTKQQQSILSILDAQIDTLGKALDFKPISLERGSYVAGSLSFGSAPIDLVTGGGAPAGRWTTTYGAAGSGKSTAVFNVIASAQAAGIPILFYDHEAAADPPYMRTLGIRLPDGKDAAGSLLRYFQPMTGESTYRHIYRILSSLPDFVAEKDGSRPKPSVVIVIDSLDSMLTEKVAEDDDNAQMGLQAKMHAQGMRLVKSLIGRKNALVMSTNQLRLKPGVSFGNPEYEPGGQAVLFYPDLKFKLNAVGKVLKERGRDLKQVNVTTIKNKAFPPFRQLHESVKTAPAIAFGLGWERGYDGRAYLISTNQIEDREVTMPGFSGKYKNEDLMRLVCSNEFRVAVRNQIESGEAFAKYFEHEQLLPPGTNLEDAGVDLPAAQSEEEVEEMTEAALPKRKRSKEQLDPDGPVKMKRATRITEDGEIVDDEADGDGLTVTRA